MQRKDYRRAPISRPIEVSAKTVDLAIVAAMRRLNARREELEIEILEEGKGGFLGFGAKEARIRAKRRPGRRDILHPISGNRPLTSRRPWQVESPGPEEEGIEQRSGERPPRVGGRSAGGRGRARPATSMPTGSSLRSDRERPQGGLSRGRDRGTGPHSRQHQRATDFAPPARIPLAPISAAPPSTLPPPEAGDENLAREIAGFARGLLERMGYQADVVAAYDDGAYEVRVAGGESDAILIGRRGETLEALQHVLAKMASRGREELVRVRVDISNYRERKNEQLAERARELGRQVRETGQAVVTEPLAAAERRVIHRTLAEATELVTHALGDGLVKRVWIGPASAEIPESEPTGEEREIPRGPDRTSNRGAVQATASSAGPPEERPEVVSWLDAGLAEGERPPATESPEWGRRPKPAKGRRSR